MSSGIRSIRVATPARSAESEPQPGLARGAAPALLAVAIMLLLALPATVLGAQSWNVARTPASVLSLIPADVTVTAVNTGGSGTGDLLGCVTVVVPAAFTVNGATVLDADGHSWTSTVTVGATTLVTVRGVASGEELQGGTTRDSVVFAINVTGSLALGSYDWTANAMSATDCSGDFGQPRKLKVTIGPGLTNTAPLGTDDGPFATSEDGIISEPAPGVLANDLDPDGDPLSASLLSGPTNGSLALAANGSFSYSPDPDFFGADTFTYAVGDGLDSSAPVTVSLDVAAVNDPPTISLGPDMVVAEDAGPQLAAGWATGIALGPANEAGQALAAVTLGVDSPALFAILPTLDPVSGDLTFAPAADANGGATVSVVLTDDGGVLNGGVDTSTAQTFRIDVSSVNDRPLAVDDQATTQENAPVAVAVTSNDVDEDGPAPLSVASYTQPSHGHVVTSSGNLVYHPERGFSGTDTFTYRLTDGAAFDRGTVEVQVKASPTPTPTPTATPQPIPTPTPGTPSSPETPATPQPSEAASPAEPSGRPSASVSPGPSAAATHPQGSAATPRPSASGANLTVGDGGTDGGLTGSVDVGLDVALDLEMLIPSLAVAMPGVILMLAIGAQLGGALAWVPAIRRNLLSRGRGRNRSLGR
jgi:hypothetical protein